MTAPAQLPEVRTEPLNASVAMRVTRSEKRAVTLVALRRGLSESEVLRTLRLEEIVVESERILRAADEMDARTVEASLFTESK